VKGVNNNLPSHDQHPISRVGLDYMTSMLNKDTKIFGHRVYTQKEIRERMINN